MPAHEAKSPSALRKCVQGMADLLQAMAKARVLIRFDFNFGDDIIPFCIILYSLSNDFHPMSEPRRDYMAKYPLSRVLFFQKNIYSVIKRR